MGRGLATAFVPRLERPTAIPGQAEVPLETGDFSRTFGALAPVYIVCLVLYKANLKLYWYTLINPKLGFLQLGLHSVRNQSGRNRANTELIPKDPRRCFLDPFFNVETGKLGLGSSKCNRNELRSKAGRNGLNCPKLTFWAIFRELKRPGQMLSIPDF